VSFVNGVLTSLGGTHVEHVIGQLVKHTQALLGVSNLSSAIRGAIRVFVDAKLVNPTFESQSKNCLTSVVSTFGSRFDLTEDMVKRVVDKLKLKDVAAAAVKAKDQKLLTSTNGSKCSSLRIPKLEDAVHAGTRRSSKCTIVVTKGDSAKAFAMAGIGGLSIEERRCFGVYPLRVSLLANIAG
jgi:DNA topoisomerase-2